VVVEVAVAVAEAAVVVVATEVAVVDTTMLQDNHSKRSTSTMSIWKNTTTS